MKTDREVLTNVKTSLKDALSIMSIVRIKAIMADVLLDIECQLNEVQ